VGDVQTIQNNKLKMIHVFGSSYERKKKNAGCISLGSESYVNQSVLNLETKKLKVNGYLLKFKKFSFKLLKNGLRP
jgi:hypothetical protein